MRGTLQYSHGHILRIFLQTLPKGPKEYSFKLCPEGPSAIYQGDYALREGKYLSLSGLLDLASLLMIIPGETKCQHGVLVRVEAYGGDRWSPSPFTVGSSRITSSSHGYFSRTHNIKKLLILPGLKGQGRDQGNHSLVRFGVVRD